ncbi:MAG: hypothetical protein Kow0042_06510 [Calditrichia bacterium]
MEDVAFNGERKKHRVLKIYREPAVISEFKLYQNYPNPFNGRTTISYNLEKGAWVSWAIYSITGQLILDEKNIWQDAGYYSVSWEPEASHSVGQSLAAGIYYFHLKTENHSATIPMVYLK